MSTLAEQTVGGTEATLEKASRYIQVLALTDQGEKETGPLTMPSLDPAACHLSSTGPHSHLERCTTSRRRWPGGLHLHAGL